MGVVMVPLLAQGTLTKEFHILVNKGLKKITGLWSLSVSLIIHCFVMSGKVCESLKCLQIDEDVLSDQKIL